MRRVLPGEPRDARLLRRVHAGQALRRVRGAHHPQQDLHEPEVGGPEERAEGELHDRPRRPAGAGEDRDDQGRRRRLPTRPRCDRHPEGDTARLRPRRGIRQGAGGRTQRDASETVIRGGRKDGKGKKGTALHHAGQQNHGSAGKGGQGKGNVRKGGEGAGGADGETR